MGVTLTTPRPSHGGLNWDSAMEADLAAIAAGINAPASLAGGSGGSTNLNNLTQSGMYQGNAATDALVNAPDAVSTFFVQVIRRDANTVAQLAFNVSTGGLWQRTATGGTWRPWARVADSGQDTGWITSGASNLVAATGWTLNSFAARVLNGVASVDATLTKTTAATATANAQGIITPTPVVTFPGGSVLTPSLSNGVFSSLGSSSTVHAAGYARSTGDIVIAELTPSTAIPIGGVIDIKGTFLV